jgi:hypothetical protein
MSKILLEMNLAKYLTWYFSLNVIS